MSAQATELDRKIRAAHDEGVATGYIEGVLVAKEANSRALLTARLGLSAMGLLAMVCASVLVYVLATC